MSPYIKPSAMFISAAGTGSLGGGCTTSNDERELLAEIFGITDWQTAFGMNEACEVQYPIEEYCKFTSVNNGASSVIVGS